MTTRTAPHPNASRPKAPKGELTGRHVLMMVIAFFGVIIAANVVFITQAVRTFPGEDVRRSYVQGLNYNETLADREAQAALGWRAAAALRRDDQGAALIEVLLIDRDGRPIEDAALEGALRRPVEARDDQALVFTPQGEGRYVAAVADLAPGQWDLRARAARGVNHFDLEARLQ